MNPKLKAILDAIDRLFADTSVSPQTTLEMMEEIRDAAESKIEALKSDG